VSHKSINGDRPLLGEQSIDISHDVANKEVGTESATSGTDEEDQTGHRLNLHLETPCGEGSALKGHDF
jgi:hypothetical protein